MVHATILGFPRIGQARELKTALEAYWKGKSSAQNLQKTAQGLRATHWQWQKDAGLDGPVSGDFTLYDQMLDMSIMLGAIPARFGWAQGSAVDLDLYFAMARGAQKAGMDVRAMEMTKWFDTNYHYIVPTFQKNQTFELTSCQPVDAYHEALALGHVTRPCLVGPVTYLRLGKREDGGDPLDLLDPVLDVYVDILRRLDAAGACWVQLDEPYLVMDLDDAARDAYRRAYERLRAASSVRLMITTPFGTIEDHLDLVLSLPVDAVHADLARYPQQLDALCQHLPISMILVAGMVDGRNIWRHDLEKSLGLLERATDQLGAERVWVSSSCSLMHVPYDLNMETALDPRLRNWMAFAYQKMEEVAILARGLTHGRDAIRDVLRASTQAALDRRHAPEVHNMDVQSRLKQQPLEQARRVPDYSARKEVQTACLSLPLYPTTTIGSFPQTRNVRKMRADYKKRLVPQESYDAFIRDEIRETITIQDEIGLDVLVHGEFERNDMVEYFGERLDGFVFTDHGWVQSYGSRCVKPPIICGDVARIEPMTVLWACYAQSLTPKPVKGMLTGPVTILQWSFVRDDQPRRVTAHQIALALQEEVGDLEKAGIRLIQIDEPAFREGLPLRRADWADYLGWAAAAFRCVAARVRPETQIHTHMCYAAFNDIIGAIEALDADVLSIETSRSHMELLDAFVHDGYRAQIGPGVYDIHSPRVPAVDEMVDLLDRASALLSPAQIWVNPDCGLKTRDWPEVRAALANMVAAARIMRQKTTDR